MNSYPSPSTPGAEDLFTRLQRMSSSKRRASKATKSSPSAKGHATAPVSAEGETECVICLENPVVRGKINSCDHVFCFECIQKWAKQENTCPLCKERFKTISKVRPDGTFTDFKTPKSCSRQRRARLPGACGIIEPLSSITLPPSLASFSPRKFFLGTPVEKSSGSGGGGGRKRKRAASPDTVKVARKDQGTLDMENSPVMHVLQSLDAIRDFLDLRANGRLPVSD